MEREVTLSEMLDAREARVFRQKALMEQYSLPVISFSLNIAGPVKNGPVIRRAFREGMSRLVDALQTARLDAVYQEEIDQVTGCEALLAVRGEARDIKRLCVELEDEDALGRLFDMDVLDPEGSKLDREGFGHPPRPCLVCGKAGKGCASRRLHSVGELQRATRTIFRDFFAQRDRDAIAGQAVRALLYEVCTTPKPGLVDRANNGSHRDMDVFTFVDSTAALLPYFRSAASIGQETAERPPGETFLRLRRAGLEAERAMLAATGGINTHKGAIFSLGTVCAAAGRLWTPESPWPSAEAILDECAAVSKEAVEADFTALQTQAAQTKGQRFFLEHGLRGIRGELADGLPAVRTAGLPALEDALKAGASLEEAGSAALIRLITEVTDTNLVARGGMEGRQWAARAAAGLSGTVLAREALEELDREFIRRNLSPGGCADLLAITYFLYFCSDKKHKMRYNM